MLGMNRLLAKREREGRPVRVGLIGAGQMGRGMVAQIQQIKGMEVIAVADIVTENAVAAYRNAGVPEDRIVRSNRLSDAQTAAQKGSWVVTEHAEIVLQLPQVEAVIDATGVPDIGAKVAYQAIQNQKHIVMLNVEADVTVGAILNKMAQSAGVIYTGAAGDEPAAIMELYDFADAIGFDVIALGKGKNNPMRLDANPDSAKEEAEAKGASPKMLASFQDGTKTMVEMNCVANATGFTPDKTGMHGPSATLEELSRMFTLQEDGGILSQKGVVDYVKGVAPGVFAVVTSEQEEVRREMQYLKMGDGPHFTLYRPYHLTSLETPLSAARAVLLGEPTIAPLGAPVAETVAVAKKDLQAGDCMDGIGGFTFYGLLHTLEEAKKANALPIGLIDRKTKLKRDVKKGEVLTFDDVELNDDSFIVHLRHLQNHLFDTKGDEMR